MNNKIRAFVVDDSAFVVASVIKKLQTDSEIEVVGSARDGKEALEKIRILKPDVITLDIVMPEMDGLSVLQHIMSEYPIPVVMLSALTSEGADITIKALELGAVDFFLKPSTLRPVGSDDTDRTLIEKVKHAATSKIKFASLIDNTTSREQDREEVSSKDQSHLPDDCPVIVIGSSTGGPRALMQLIPALPPGFPAAILIVQHMPPLFTKSLAERLRQASKIYVSEACAGSIVRTNQALMAPGDYHMLVSKGHHVILNQEPTVQGVRPSIDVTMKSVVEVYGPQTIGVVLTGMGCDGTTGASCIKAVGGKIITQSESTCAVYGMPQSIVKAGYADKILDLNRIAPELTQMCLVTSESR